MKTASKLRKTLISWRDAPYRDKMPTYIGEGHVFVFPAQELGITHYLVTRTKRGKSIIEWGCTCKSYGHKEEDKIKKYGDDCKHIEQLREEWEANT